MDVATVVAVVGVPTALLGLGTAYFQYRNAQAAAARESSTAPPRRRARGWSLGAVVDLGSAVHPGSVLGRETELAQLRAWLSGNESRRLVGILGPPGIGKSSLASMAVTSESGRRRTFDFVVWRSVKDGPSPVTVLAQLIALVSGGRRAATGDWEGDLSRLTALLGRTTVLLVLDNVESLLDGSAASGEFLADFVRYRQVIHAFASAGRPSTLLLTGRELPAEVHLAPARAGAAAILRLGGLPEQAALDLVRQYTLHGNAEELRYLCKVLSGNPLKLQLAASAAAETYGGDVSAYLESYAQTPGDLGALVRSQTQRISPVELRLLDWLTVERRALTVPELRELIADPTIMAEIPGAVTSLYRRSLVERAERGRFVLQPAVSEHLTEAMVRRCSDEIVTVAPNLLEHVALFNPDAPDHIQQAQRRYLLHAVLDRSGAFSDVQPSDLLRQMQDRHRGRMTRATSFLAGNLVNLAAVEGLELRRLRLAGCVVRRADLTMGDATEADLRDARLFDCRFHMPVSSIHAMAFSPDGNLVAFGGSTGEIWISRMADFTEVGRLSGHVDWIRSLAFHPDGTLLASASDDGTVRVWDHEAGHEVARCTGHAGKVTGVLFDERRQRMISAGDDGFLVVWSTRTWQEDSRSRAHDCQIWALDLSPDGTLVATGGEENTIRLWHSDTLTPHSVLTGHSDWVLTVCFAESPLRLVSGGHDGTVRVWHVGTETVVTTAGHGSWVWAVAAHGPWVAAGYGDGMISAWSVPNDSRATQRTLLGHAQRVWCLGFEPAGHLLVSGADDETLRAWDTSSGDCVRTLHGSTTQLCSVHAGPQWVVSGGADGRLRVWRRDEPTGWPVAELSGHTGRIWSVRAVGAGQIVSGGEDGTVRLWERIGQVWQGRIVADLSQQIWSIEAIGDGSRVAAVRESGVVSIIDVTTGEVVQEIEGHEGWVWSVAAASDGTRIATAAYDRSVGWWDTHSGQFIARLTGHDAPVTSVCVSTPLSRVLSGAYDGEVRIWDTDALACTAAVPDAHSGPVWGAACSPSGRLAVTGGGDGTVRVWDLETGTARHRLPGHQGWVLRVAFCDDHTLVSGDHLGGIRMWDAFTGRCISTFRAPRAYENLDLRGSQGLTLQQLQALSALGARVD
ncbi:WD40 repeat protein [Streptomyces sp. SAI-208]|uniref:WD40 domain-containing protein n=1 Tax=Streptomyces sp. SAI-208 TaxID=2940550 RepID=UPI00247496FB|nr:NB-ARC domain-containing protein [Streptomyces sp. SAI-208]MDH6604435.1 WD40 repeat protein [Streptomyces sp. SAI-208]